MPTRMVAIFKDHLYFDDPTEYLRRFYFLQESHWRLPKVFEFLQQNRLSIFGQTKLQPLIRGERAR
jgi:hypothetical protein